MLSGTLPIVIYGKEPCDVLGEAVGESFQTAAGEQRGGSGAAVPYRSARAGEPGGRNDTCGSAPGRAAALRWRVGRRRQDARRGPGGLAGNPGSGYSRRLPEPGDEPGSDGGGGALPGARH